MADQVIMALAELTDGELEAALLLLGERAQEITDASALVRGERDRRRLAGDQPTLGTLGTQELTAAVKGAPARAEELRQVAEWEAAVEEQRLAAEAAELAAREAAAQAGG